MERGWFGRTGLIRMTPEWREPLFPRQGLRRKRRVLVITIFEMVQDLADDAGLGDERNEAHFPAAVCANQRVGFEHTAYQVGPSSPKGFAVDFVERVVVGCGSMLWDVFSSSSGVVPIVEDRMLLGLRDVDEHPGDELERVEELGFSIF